MTKIIELSHIRVGVKGGGDLASGVVWRLHQCGFKVFITEIDQPRAVRRTVAFCEAVYDGNASVEGVEALLVETPQDVDPVWAEGKVPLLVDPSCESRHSIKPDVLVDAILAKKNLGTTARDAPLVIALGPGFEAGRDAHFVVETNRGHNLARLLTSGSAEPNTGIPGPIEGITTDRVLKATADGLWENRMEIADPAKKGDLVGSVSGNAVTALIDGVVRGMIRPGIAVTKGLKIGDIDPRGNRDFCYTISEKARAISGAVLEGILRYHGR